MSREARSRRLLGLIGWILAAVLAVVLVLVIRQAHRAQDAARVKATIRAVRCDAARDSALDEVRNEVRKRQLAQRRSGWRPRMPNWDYMPQALSTYTLACLDRDRFGAKDSHSSQIELVIGGLLDRGRFDEVDAIVEQLDARPLEEWDEVELPTLPCITCGFEEDDEP